MNLSLTIQGRVCRGPKQKQKNKPIDFGPCDWLVSLLPTPTIQSVVNGIGIGQNGNVQILPTPISSGLLFQLLIFTGCSYDSDFYSVASENQPLKSLA